MRQVWLVALVVAAVAFGAPAAALEQRKGEGGAPPVAHRAEEPSRGNGVALLHVDGEAASAAGEVHWRRGTADAGVPTIIAEGALGNELAFTLTISRNADGSLPASHLIEVEFVVGPGFAGGGIAQLTGVSLRQDTPAAGRPLIGASARVVAGQFIFAAAGFEPEATANADVLRGGGDVDLSVVYGDGRRAVLSLETDAAAGALFAEVLAAWDGHVNRPVRTVRVRPDGSIVSD